MERSVRRSGIVAALLLAAAASSSGCGATGLLDQDRGQPIPDGAQQVHVTIDRAQIRLVPDTVAAGDVYLVLDSPADGHVAFVGGAGPGLPPDAPLAPGSLDRLAHGVTEGTAISGLDAGGCSDAQNEADRGKTGPCGNVMLVHVLAGEYALLPDMPEANAEAPGSVPIAVLTVTP